MRPVTQETGRERCVLVRPKGGVRTKREKRKRGREKEESLNCRLFVSVYFKVTGPLKGSKPACQRVPGATNELYVLIAAALFPIPPIGDKAAGSPLKYFLQDITASPPPPL